MNIFWVMLSKRAHMVMRQTPFRDHTSFMTIWSPGLHLNYKCIFHDHSQFLIYGHQIDNPKINKIKHF